MAIWKLGNDKCNNGRGEQVMTLNKVTEFAKEKGYDGVQYLKDWNGYACYEPIISDSVLFIGLSLVIMVKGDEIRMSTSDEAMKI